jgi:hypothetical protein
MELRLAAPRELSILAWLAELAPLKALSLELGAQRLRLLPAATLRRRPGLAGCPATGLNCPRQLTAAGPVDIDVVGVAVMDDVMAALPCRADIGALGRWRRRRRAVRQ